MVRPCGMPLKSGSVIVAATAGDAAVGAVGSADGFGATVVVAGAIVGAIAALGMVEGGCMVGVAAIVALGDGMA